MQRGERSAAQPAEGTDGVLVGQALAGDERAFESLVHRYDASLFARMYRYMGDNDQSCDVLLRGGVHAHGCFAPQNAYERQVMSGFRERAALKRRIL
jgi:hypothetical protein